MRPSFIGHAVNGLLMMVATIMLYCNSDAISRAEMIQIIALLSIAYGIHSILHHYEELYYNFNPLENKWSYTNKKPKKTHSE
jgi:hypothetical protein